MSERMKGILAWFVLPFVIAVLGFSMKMNISSADDRLDRLEREYARKEVVELQLKGIQHDVDMIRATQEKEVSDRAKDMEEIKRMIRDHDRGHR